MPLAPIPTHALGYELQARTSRGHILFDKIQIKYMFVNKNLIEEIYNKALKSYNQCISLKENSFLESEISHSLKELNVSEEIIKITHKTNKSEVVNIEVDFLLSYEANLIGEYKYIEDNLGNTLDEFLLFY